MLFSGKRLCFRPETSASRLHQSRQSDGAKSISDVHRAQEKWRESPHGDGSLGLARARAVGLDLLDEVKAVDDFTEDLLCTRM